MTNGTFLGDESYRATVHLRLAQFHATRSSTILARYAAMRTPRDEQDGLAPLFRRCTRKRTATPEGEETSSLRRRQRNIVASAFATARAEYLAGKPVGIILVGGVTAEINYVRDEIPGLRAATIENGSSPVPRINSVEPRSSRFESSSSFSPGLHSSMMIRLCPRRLN